MIVQEKFYTISKTELKKLCSSLVNAQSNFDIAFESSISSLKSQKRIGDLEFYFYIDYPKENECLNA